MAERVLKLVRGIPRMVDISTGAVTIKDEGVIVESNITEIDFTGSSVQATSTGTGKVKVDHSESGGDPAIYDETLEVSGTISSGTNITLPSNKQYNSEELEIYVNGQRVEAEVDFEYVGTVPRDQISFNYDLVDGDLVRFRIDREYSDTPTIYDESLEVVSGTPGSGEISGPISAGTPVTLPASQTYEDDELEVWLNGARISDLYDYNYVGTSPRTQIEFTFELVVGDVLRFRIDREA